MEHEPTADEPVQLTRRQELIWVEEQLNPDLPANNMVMTFRIEGALDVDGFAEAFASVVRDHDALRTVIIDQDDGSASQQVIEGVPRDIDFVDLGEEERPERTLRDWLDERCAKPLRLAECAYDSALVRLADEKWLWYFCQDHIITDGSSFSILYRRVAERYTDPGATFPEAATFSEYRRLERQYRDSPRAKDACEFWRARSEQSIEPLRLYGMIPAQRRACIRRISVPLGKSRSAALRAIATHPEYAGVTPGLSETLVFVTILLAYLHRVTGNRRIGIGMPVQNRRIRAVRETVGLLMEVVAIRVDIEPDDAFDALLSRAREELYEVMRYAQYGVTNSSHAPAFEVMLNFHNARFPDFAGLPTKSESFCGLLTQTGAPRKEATYWRSGEDLSIQVQDFGGKGEYTVDFDFSIDVFPGDAMARAVEHYRSVLDAFVADPKGSIRDVELLGEQERKRVLLDFNPDATPRAIRSVVHGFEARAAAIPDRVALRFGSEIVSYGGVEQRSARLARELMARGVDVGDRVAVLLERSNEIPIAMLGVLRSGAAYVPLDPEHPPARNQGILAVATPRVIVTQRSLAAALQLDSGVECVCIEDLRDTESAGSRETRLPIPDDLAYVIFTSGSTGRPKGVEVTHASLMNFVEAMLLEPVLDETDVLVSVTTFAFDIIALDFYVTLLAGAELVLTDRATSLEPARLATLLDRSGATVMQATPATWRMLIEDGWSGRDTLRALCGGEAMSRDLADALVARCDSVWNLYGPTEATVWCTMSRVLPSLPGVPSPPSVSIGRPIRNLRVYILDDRMRPVPIGVTGEIWIAGAGVARGYCGRPDLTAEVFRPDPFSAMAGERMYRSGDLGRHEPDGQIVYMGRRDHQVKVRGFRVELAEIEHVIDADSSVHECAVIARTVSHHETMLAAYVTGAGGKRPDLAALRARLREQLPGYMIPADFVVLDALPLTGSGKLDRNNLPEPDAEGRLVDIHYVAPATQTEIVVARIWASELGLATVGVHDSFFDLGGHSLMALRIFRTLRDEYDILLPIATLFEASTVRRLAEKIEDVRSGVENAEFSTLVPIQPEGTRMPLFVAAGAGGNIHNLAQLAKRLGFDQPFYGLQTPGVVGHRLLHRNIEEIARQSVDDLRKFQAEGPYLLGGYSAGGSVAFEMAHLLKAQGEEVAAFILLDSYSTVIPRRSRSQRIAIHFERLREEGLAYVGRKLIDRLAGDRARIKNTLRRIRNKLMADQYRHENFMAEREELEKRYRPRPLAGSATLFRVDRRLEDAPTHMAIDETNGWKSLFQEGVRVIAVPGGHLDMCEEPHVSVLAARLGEILDDVHEAAKSNGDAVAGAMDGPARG